jgi:hypothetical protein
MLLNPFRFGGGGPPAGACRFFRLRITGWVFNGSPNVTDLGDLRVLEMQLFDGATQYPTSPMTTNTAPSPLVASASGSLTGFGDLDPWNAFNHSLSGNQWMGDGGAAPRYLQIDLGSGNEIVPTSLKIAPDGAVFTGGGYYLTAFSLAGSNTGGFTGEETTYLTVSGLVQGDWAPSTLKTFAIP